MIKLFKIIFITTLIFFINYQICFSTDTISAKYYPLNIGNSWTYYHTVYLGGNPYRYKVTITSATVINGHIYYNDQRVDSTYGRLLKYSINGCQWLINEILVDSLSSRIRDTFSINCGGYYWSRAVCTDTALCVIFGLQRQSKKFSYSGFESVGYRRYVKDIGMVKYYSTNGINFMSDTLLGCVINGVVYGDTSMTGITKISSGVPENFSLYQNYPNPFNPTTKIRFSISTPPQPSPKGRENNIVNLIIYDILGREIQTLVNEQLSPGIYEVEFNGSNYPSGIYYYILTAGYFSQTKKMVLVK